MNDMVMALSEMGRGMDDRIAHVAPGEIVIPRQVIDRQPQLLTAIIKAFQKASNGQVDWRKFVVGTDEDRGNANPTTGLSDFDFDSAADAYGLTGFDTAGNDSIETAAMGTSEPGIVDFSTPASDAQVGERGAEGGDASFTYDNPVPPFLTEEASRDIGVSTLPQEKPVPDFLVEEASRDTGRSTLPTPQNSRSPIDLFTDWLPGIGGIKQLLNLIPDNRSPDVIDRDNQTQADLEAASAGMVGGSNSPSPIGEFDPTAQAAVPSVRPSPMPTATPTPNQIMEPRYVRPPAITEPRLLGIPSDMDELQRRAMIATYGVNADEGKWRDPFTVEYYKNLITRGLIDDAGNPLPLNLLPVEEQYLREVAGLDLPPTSEGLLDILTGKTAATDRAAIEEGLVGAPPASGAGAGNNNLMAAFQTDPALAQLLAQILSQRPRTSIA